MKKEIQIQMKLPDKWVSNQLSIDDSIRYCTLAVSSYSISDTFDDRSKARQYAFCKTMLNLVQMNHGMLINVCNASKKHVSFTLAFNKDNDYSHFYDGFVDFLKSCGYKKPEEPD